MELAERRHHRRFRTPKDTYAVMWALDDSGKILGRVKNISRGGLEFHVTGSGLPLPDRTGRVTLYCSKGPMVENIPARLVDRKVISKGWLSPEYSLHRYGIEFCCENSNQHGQLREFIVNHAGGEPVC